MMERPGGALVITAYRTDFLSVGLTPMPPDDVTYTFLDKDQQKHRNFTCLKDAVAAIAEDIKGDDILPVGVTETRFTRYNPLDLVSTPRPVRRAE